VTVEVFAERYQTQGQYAKVTEATLTYVAIDEQGKPQRYPRARFQPPVAACAPHRQLATGLRDDVGRRAGRKQLTVGCQKLHAGGRHP